MIIKKKIKTQTEEVLTTEEVIQDVKEEEINLFDLDNIDFRQRQERRRGDRRRGYRRIDDRNLISRAKEEAQSLKEVAMKEGYEEGLNQAKEDIDYVKKTITSFLTAKQEVFDYIVPTIIINNIVEILKTLSKDETKITLNVNPIQVSLLKQELPEKVTSMGIDAKLIIVADDRIMEGGCLVTTSNGVIDATIETQLSVISEALKGI